MKQKLIEVTCHCCSGKFFRRRHTIHCLIEDQLIFFNKQHQKRYYSNGKVSLILSATEARNKKLMTGVKANVVGGLRFKL